MTSYTAARPTRPGQTRSLESSPALPRSRPSQPARICWVIALLFMVLDLHRSIGAPNINFFEKSIFLLAGFFYLRAGELRPLRIAIFSTFLLVVVLSGLLSDNLALEWPRVFNAMVAISSVLLFTLASPARSDAEFYLTTLKYAAIASLSWGLILMVTMGRPMFIGDHTGALRLGGSTLPAFLAPLCWVSAMAAAVGYLKQHNLRDMAIAVFCLGTCVLTGSRMPTACALGSLLVFLMISHRDALSRFSFIFLALMLGGTFFAVAGDQIMIRFLSGSESGRDLVRNVLVQSIEAHPWFGIGYGHHGLLIPERVVKVTGTAAAHNEYVRNIVELGYIGGIAALILLALLVFAPAASASRLLRPAMFVTASLYFVFGATDNVFYLSICLLIPVTIHLIACANPPTPELSPSSKDAALLKK